jgi:phosphatidylglycerophosphate synthase
MSNCVALLDCRLPASQIRLYSLSVFERLCRQLYSLGIHRIFTVTEQDQDFKQWLRSDFAKRFPIEFTRVQPADRFPDFNEILLLQSNGLYDTNVLKALLEADELKIDSADGPLALKIKDRNSALTAGEMLINRQMENIRRVSIDQYEYYDRDLRQPISPFFLNVKMETNIRVLENLMYEKTFKGAMDFIASYIYKIPVREMVRLLAPTRVTPNMITVLSILCSILAIPFFAIGMLGIGTLLGFLFIVFDSLDGKLARLTVNLTPEAGHWDRKTSTPAVALWSIAWGWHFSGGQLYTIPFFVGLLIFGLTLVDKWTRMAFRALTRRSILDFSHIDRIFHLFASKRTTNLFILTVGLIATPWFPTADEYAFYTIMLWLTFTWLYHLGRLVYEGLKRLTVINGKHP